MQQAKGSKLMITSAQKEETCKGLFCKKKNDFWYSLDIGTRQMKHLKMLCNFHLQESENEKVKECTRKLLYCLNKFSISKDKA